MNGLVCPNNEVPISVVYQHSVLLFVKFFSLLIQLVCILLILQNNFYIIPLTIDRFAGGKLYCSNLYPLTIKTLNNISISLVGYCLAYFMFIQQLYVIQFRK